MSLNNYFLSRKKEEESIKHEQDTELIYQQQVQRSQKNIQYSANMAHRLENFVDNRFSSEYIQSIESGSIPLTHINFHQFRDRDQKKEMDSKGGITIKTFQTAQVRAETSQSQFRSSHLEQGMFNPNDPHKSMAHWLRVDNKAIESKPLRFGLKSRTENQRLRENIVQSKIDNSIKDTKMLHYPEWKSDEKEKWISKDVLSNAKQNFTLNPQTLLPEQQARAIWKEIPVYLENQNNTFIDGHEVVGDITRKRQKEKEGKRTDFIETVKPDVLGTQMQYSQSLRTKKQDEALNVKQDYDLYSTNSKIPYYKQALLKTKSIDHQVPYQHSNKQSYKTQTNKLLNSYQGIPLRDLRPSTQGKIYIKSLAHFSHNLTPQAFVQMPKVKNLTIQQPKIELNTPLGSYKTISLAKIQEAPGSTVELENRNKQPSRTKLEKQIQNLNYPYNQLDDESTKKRIEKYFN